MSINTVIVNPGPTCYSRLVKIYQAFAWQCLEIVECVDKQQICESPTDRVPLIMFFIQSAYLVPLHIALQTHSFLSGSVYCCSKYNECTVAKNLFSTYTCSYQIIFGMKCTVEGKLLV